jgi:hypothetical protein
MGASSTIGMTKMPLGFAESDCTVQGHMASSTLLVRGWWACEAFLLSDCNIGVCSPIKCLLQFL